MSESVQLVLGDILREWLRGDPTLNEHFYVHKQTEWFEVKFQCDPIRSICCASFNDNPQHMYFNKHQLNLSPAHPDYFPTLEKLIRRDHNAALNPFGKKACDIVL